MRASSYITKILTHYPSDIYEKQIQVKFFSVLTLIGIIILVIQQNRPDKNKTLFVLSY